MKVMMKLIHVSCALILASAVAAAGVDPALLSLAMPDAKILSGIDVERSKASRFGQYVLGQMTMGSELRGFGDQSGFDPRRDLKELLVATGDAGSLILARGTFDPARIVAAAEASGSRHHTTYQGVTMLQGAAAAGDHTPSGVLAFLSSSVALAGDEALVKAAIDRRAANTNFSGPLAQKAREVSALNQTWFATLSSPSDFFQGKLGAANAMSQSNLLENVTEAWGGIQFRTDSVVFSGDVISRTEKDAQGFADVLKFLAGLLVSNSNAGGAAASVAQATKITADGTTVHLSLAMPEALVEQLFIETRAKKPPAQ